jgi:hypothetical protein
VKIWELMAASKITCDKESPERCCYIQHSEAVSPNVRKFSMYNFELVTNVMLGTLEGADFA